jgi:anti-sigma factor RsiW
VNCEHCQEQLIDYVHDELGAEAGKAIAVHLAQCSSCALEYCRLRADVEGIARAYCESPSPVVREALRDRVHREFAPSLLGRLARVLKRPVPVYGAAVAAVLPVLVWIATDVVRDERTHAPSAVERPAKITDYDATRPLVDRNIL